MALCRLLMMIKYKVGYNFDLQLVDFIRKVNEVNENAQIDSVYSSIMWHDKLTARPKYKLANLSICELELHIKALHRIGVSFCYPLNASYIGSKNAISVEKLNITFTFAPFVCPLLFLNSPYTRYR